METYNKSVTEFIEDYTNNPELLDSFNEDDYQKYSQLILFMDEWPEEFEKYLNYIKNNN